jgi:VWFA-related protein
MRPIIATLLAGLLAASAQQRQNTVFTPTSGAVKISTNVQLVVVDVSVKDKSGKPIEGLTAKDFTITEDGKPQDIKVFQFQKLEETVLPEPALTPRGPAAAPPASPAPAATAPAAPAPAAVKSISANQIAPARPGEVKYKDRRLLVMFFDMTSMPIQDQFRAVTAAQKFLKTQMTKSDLMAILTFSSELKVVQDFTDDRDALMKIVKSLPVGEGSDMAVAGSTGAENEEDTGDAYTADDTEFNIFNTDRKLAALETATKMLGSLPEKKALVYFASGVSRTGTENQAQLEATINAAIRNNVSFYPIDARGLVASAPLGDATKASPGGTNALSGAGARSAQSQFQGQQETLYTLAADTGGKALLDSNDLALGIVQAQQDIASYYIIGYYSTNDKLDGHYRRIKLNPSPTLTAKIGKIDYRQGYFAGKEFARFTSSDRERQLQEALMLGDPMTDLTIALEANYFRLARDRYFVPITLKIPGSEFELARHGGAETTKIDFIGEVRDAKNQIKANVRDESEVKLKGQTLGQLAKHTLAYNTGFTLDPGVYTLKVLARENQTGKMGTFQTKFTIPDLTTEQRRLPISSVVLSNQREDLGAAVFNAERDRRLLFSDPLVQDNKRLIPSVTRVFRKDQEMYVYLEAYEPTAEKTQPLVASVGFYRGKVKAFETAPLQVTDGLNARSKAVPVKFSVPLAKLQPGKYECQVSIFDPSARKFNFWRANVVILPETVAQAAPPVAAPR